MNNGTLFLAYLAVWLVYLLFIYLWRRRNKLDLILVSVSHIVPTLVAVIMVRIFLIGGGATVVQFVAGSEDGMDMWKLWFDLWPLLLVITAISAFINLICTIIYCFRKKERNWIAVYGAATLMSVFAFFTVGTNFPDA